MEFQTLLNKIKNFKENIDFIFTSQTVMEDKRYEKVEVYSIISSQLKKEARRLMLNSDIENGGFSRVGREIDGKWYEYEKGDDNQSDKFEIKVISSEQREEIQRRKERMEHDREKLEKNRKEFEEREKEWEKSFGNSKKKCDNCGKELDSKSAKETSVGQPDSNLNRVYFCSDSDCSEIFFRKKYNQKKQEDNLKCVLKCVECGDTPEGKDYWEWIGTGDKTYCMSCSDKLPKISETELKKRNLNALKSMKIKQEQIKLEALNSKLRNSTNPAEKKELKIKIEEAKNCIKELESEDKSKNNSNLSPVHPSKGYGKIIFSVIAIFSVVILVSILVVKTRKQRRKINP